MRNQYVRSERTVSVSPRGSPQNRSSSQRSQQFRNKRSPVGNAIYENAFVGGMRAFTDAAQAVERRDSEGRSEIAVRAAAREGLLNLHAQFLRQFLRGPKQLHDPGGP